jgi:alpha-1,2-mannosyltransferase
MLLVGSWAVSFVLMAATSTEVGGLFAEGQGHEIAQGYGSFLWAGVVLYTMVAWRVWARRSETLPAGLHSRPISSVPKSHLNTASQSRPFVTS